MRALTLLVAWLAPAQDADAERLAAHLAQVAQAVELFAEYEGRLPMSLTELVERPGDARFWPEGGFLAGAAVPQGIEYAQGDVRTGDRAVRIAPFPETLTVPFDRSRWHTARVHVMLVAAAVRALRDSTGRLPARLEDLRHPVADGLFASPVGTRLELLQEGETAWIRLHLRAGPVESPAHTAQRVRDLAPSLGSEDPEERDQATRELIALGMAALPAIEEAIAAAQDAEVRARLEYARAQLTPPVDPDEALVDAFVIRVASRTDAAIRTNERAVAGSMMSIANGNETASNTLFGGVYWSQDLFGLYALGRFADQDFGRGVRFITDLGLARADIRPVRDDPRYAEQPPAVPQPRSGYFLRAFPFEGQVEGMGTSYGICAFPAEYGVTGRLTFIIDEEATVYSRDLHGRPVDHWPTSAEKGTHWESSGW